MPRICPGPVYSLVRMILLVVEAPQTRGLHGMELAARQRGGERPAHRRVHGRLEFIKGTSIWPSLNEWNGAVLFLEISEESPSPTLVTRWLRNYAAQGILHRAGAILFGRPGGRIGPTTFAGHDKAIRGVVTEEQGLPERPIVTGMDFGHTDPFITVPIGVRTEVDCGHRRFAILEAAVS